MKRVINLLSGTALFALPVVAGAQIADSADLGDFGNLLENILTVTNTLLIPFIIGIGFLFFVWGMFLYFIKGGSDEDAQGKGKSLMIYATLGFVLIIVFWGIVNLVASSTGLENERIEDLPVVTPR